MRRWETLTALLAVVLASMAALPIHSRLFFALAAMVLIAVVGGSRLRAAMLQRGRAPNSFDPAERAARIRAGRTKR